jgi:hypothetical protein
MCERIMGQLPSIGDWQRLSNVFMKYGFSPELQDGITYAVTGSSCDCGTALGQDLRDKDRVKHTVEKFQKQIELHRKKGWSEAKISRWITDASKGPDQVRRVKEDELQNWRHLLNDLLVEKALSFVRLTVYSTDAGDHVIEKGSEPIKYSLASLDESVLSSMASGRWYEFVR